MDGSDHGPSFMDDAKAVIAEAFARYDAAPNRVGARAALELLAQAFAAHPHSLGILVTTLQFCRYAGEARRGVALCERELAHFKSHRLFIYEYGNLLRASGATGAAAQVHKKLAETMLGDAMVQCAHVLSEAAHGRPNEVHAKAEQLVSRSPTPKHRHALARVLLKLGRFRAALELCDELLAEPGYFEAEALQAIAEAAHALRDTARWTSAARRLHARDDTTGAANLWLARTLAEEGASDAAERALRRACEVEPDYAPAFAEAAARAWQGGDAARAEELFQIAARLWPDSWEIRGAFSELLVATARREVDIDELARMAGERPHTGLAYHLARIRWRVQHDAERGARLYRLHLVAREEDVAAWWELGELHMRTGAEGEAWRCFASATRIAPLYRPFSPDALCGEITRRMSS
jgi:tetratricopeptide (TPR) repeat protein